MSYEVGDLIHLRNPSVRLRRGCADAKWQDNEASGQVGLLKVHMHRYVTFGSIPGIPLTARFKSTGWLRCNSCMRAVAVAGEDACAAKWECHQ
jgi:hypothetical protein